MDLEIPRHQPRPERTSPVEPEIPRPPMPVPARRPRSENLDRLFLYRRGEVQWDQVTGFRGGPKRHGHQLMLWSFMAVLIDAMILVSLSCFFVLAFAAVVRSPLGELVGHLAQLGAIRLLAMVFIATMWFYLVTCRIFFGFTVGEWACDLRLGQPTERARATYALRVVLRATLLVATGVVTLPLLSLLLGRDLTGRLSGVRLMSLR